MSRQDKNQVKDAIRALCHIMNASGFITAVNCECFRQGKFNKVEAIAPLSRFLCELVEQRKWTSTDDEASQDEMWTSLLKWNIFSARTPSGISELGSRDILLHVGWFLASSNLVNKQVERILKSSSVLSPSNFLSGTEKGKHRNPDSGDEMKSLQHGCLDARRANLQPSAAAAGRLKHIVWMMGRLRLALKSLLSEQQALCRLMHRVHTATLGNAAPSSRGSNHLSILDAFIMRHPNTMKDYLRDLEKEAALLQACLSWQQLEPIFWQWMVSVQREVQSSSAEHGRDFPSTVSPADADQSACHLKDSQTAKSFSKLRHMEAALGCLLQSLDAELASRHAHQMLQQVNSCADAAKRKADVENSVRVKLAYDIEEHSKSSNWNVPLQCVQFSYEPELAKRKQKQKSETPQQNSLDLKREILQLKDRTRRLQDELRELRIAQQNMLVGFADCLTNVVCIPPMSDRADHL